jgi:hypothetical protein
MTIYSRLSVEIQSSSLLLPRLVSMLSIVLGSLLFVLCVMPFFLNLVFRLQRPSFSDEEAPQGLLVRTMGYGALAVVAEVALRLLMRLMQRPLGSTPPMGSLIGQSLIGLATVLITSLPTIACVVAIAMMVMDVEEPVTDREPA